MTANNNSFRPAPPVAYLASYSEQRIPRYKGHKLIEALQPSKSDQELIESLSLRPDFSPEQREWETHERLHQLAGLSNMMMLLESHLHLARFIDTTMREGYVGRRPQTADHIEISQRIYRVRKAGQSFRQTAETLTPQRSAALLGMSGMGKTTTVQRILAQTEQVIFHPDLDLYQITYLHIETPSDGRSLKALATAILQQADRLIPDRTYYKDYSGNGRNSGDTMMHGVANVMNNHLVGLLVCDEVQNLGNSKKDDQILMTELVSACNTLKVPILFIGTHKAEKILGLDFRQGRRSLGPSLGDWSPLPRAEIDGSPGEWVAFMQELWVYQWVRTPIALTDGMLDVFYDCTQGVIDLAIKLYAAAQAKAMSDGSETLTEQLVTDVYKKHMRLIHPMIDAMRRNDLTALSKYQDIKQLPFNELVEDVGRAYRVHRLPGASIRAGSENFVPVMTNVAIAAGIPAEDAYILAQGINKEGTAKNTFEGMQQMAAKVAKPKRVSKPKAKSDSAEVPEADERDFRERPLDYRHATKKAKVSGVSVAQTLVDLSLSANIGQLLNLQ
jgi:AAA domain